MVAWRSVEEDVLVTPPLRSEYLEVWELVWDSLEVSKADGGLEER